MVEEEGIAGMAEEDVDSDLIPPSFVTSTGIIWLMSCQMLIKAWKCHIFMLSIVAVWAEFSPFNFSAVLFPKSLNLAVLINCYRILVLVIKKEMCIDV